MNNISSFIDFNFNTICEIGVFMPDSIQCKDIINPLTSVIFIEPNPICAKELKKIYNSSNIQVINKAITDTNSDVKLYMRGNQDPSAFIETVPFSPLLTENFKKDQNYIICEGITFDKVDPKNIDILCLDMEGAEWFALKHMTSRPKLISVEMQGANYINPFKSEIEQWMNNNNYQIIHHGMNDTYYKLI